QRSEIRLRPRSPPARNVRLELCYLWMLVSLYSGAPPATDRRSIPSYSHPYGLTLAMRTTQSRFARASCAHEALGLVFGPSESLLHGLALHVSNGHLGHQTLRVNLHGDFWWRRSGSD